MKLVLKAHDGKKQTAWDAEWDTVRGDGIYGNGAHGGREAQHL